VSKNVLRKLKLRKIFCVGEILTPKMKDFFEQRFDCPVSDNYGLTEFNIVAYQKKIEKDYTINYDNVIVEGINDPDLENFKNIKKAVISSLSNYFMPLIRYNTGDFIEFSKKSKNKIQRIFGWKEYFIKDRKKIIYLGDIVDILISYAEYLYIFNFILQKDRLVINLVKKRNYTNEIGHKLISNIKNRLKTSLDISIKIKDKIRFGRRGKLKLLSNY
jgi:phenylacetate-CoA ligase